jgi:hypothetical protein
MLITAMSAIRPDMTRSHQSHLLRCVITGLNTNSYPAIISYCYKSVRPLLPCYLQRQGNIWLGAELSVVTSFAVRC